MSRHLMRGRQLSRDTEHRKALRRNLVQSLFEHGKVRTTLPKAKEVRAFAEKIITLAKTGVTAGDRGDADGKRISLNCRRRVISALQDRRITDKDQEFIKNPNGRDRTVIQKLFEEIAPQFSDRSGGYTRIIKLSDYRIGDGGSLVLLQLLTEASAPRGAARRSAGLRRRRNERRQQFATQSLKDKRGGRRSEPAAAAAVSEASSEPSESSADEASQT